MSFDLNDPRLTAYALGEMSDEEKRAFEAILAESPEARAEVKAISDLAKDLEADLAEGAPIELGAPRRSAIERGAANGATDTHDAAETDGAKAKNGAPKANGTAKNGTAKKAAHLEVIDGARKPAKESDATKPAGRSTAWRFGYYVTAAAVAAGAVGLYVVSGGGNKFGKEKDEESAATSAHARMEMGDSDGKSKKGNSRFGIQGPGAATAAPAPMAAASARADFDTKPTDEPRGKLDDKGVAFPPGQAMPENPFVDTKADAKSTFSIDVDTASYSMIRRTLQGGSMPSADYVRLEEMVNYFPYAYPQPDDAAFSVTTDVASAPWQPTHRLVRIGLHGREIRAKARPASNLVFLLDVSGSMDSPDKLPLLVQGLTMLTETLDERDHVAIVVYAGATGLVLPSTAGNARGVITAALSQLKAGGSTNGGAGITLAYEEAKKNFVPGGVNRVILATDGDFNVGITNQNDLVKLVQEKAKDGVFLTVLGFGSGNYRDTTLENLADKGNGNYAYIDGVEEAKKVLVAQASGTLTTIAKDVKIQVTFDPQAVQSFKLLGYENRVLSHQDFTDDKKDAGEIGAGHTVTALYEVVMKDGAAKENVHVADVALRYKEPEADKSRLVESKVTDGGTSFESAPVDFRFAAGVAGFGLLLRGSKTVGDFGYNDVERIASVALGDDREGYRKEFVDLVKRAEGLAHK